MVSLWFPYGPGLEVPAVASAAPGAPGMRPAPPVSVAAPSGRWRWKSWRRDWGQGSYYRKTIGQSLENHRKTIFESVNQLLTLYFYGKP